MNGISAQTPFHSTNHLAEILTKKKGFIAIIKDSTTFKNHYKIL